MNNLRLALVRNIKLTLEYDGTRFNGWQVQDKSKRTVQGELNTALSRIFQEKCSVIGSGRTDSGVHAKGQVANFKTTSSMTPIQILKALNTSLPEDVSASKVEEVSQKFHAQYSAKSKTYRYTILNSQNRSALSRDFSFFYPYPLNLTRIRRELKNLLGKKDFKSFQAHDSAISEESLKNKSTIRTIKRLEIQKNGNFIFIEIEADGFLYKMVRNIVGTLLEIGSGKRSESLKKILNAKDRRCAGQTAPAKGLCLREVRY